MGALEPPWKPILLDSIASPIGIAPNLAEFINPLSIDMEAGIPCLRVKPDTFRPSVTIPTPVQIFCFTIEYSFRFEPGKDGPVTPCQAIIELLSRWLFDCDILSNHPTTLLGFPLVDIGILNGPGISLCCVKVAMESDCFTSVDNFSKFGLSFVY